MVIQDIQEVGQYIELKFRLSMNWKDARVLFYNLKEEEAMNSSFFGRTVDSVDTNDSLLEYKTAA